MTTDTIAAVATALSNSGIGIIRVSGNDAVPIVNTLFKNKKRQPLLEKMNSHTIQYGFIVNDQDEYMGTVSLKNIDRIRQCAEFAITIRKSAMGKGYSAYGMQEIISEGFELLHLKYIYWYVRKENMRAIKFYEKMGMRTKERQMEYILVEK